MFTGFFGILLKKAELFAQFHRKKSATCHAKKREKILIFEKKKNHTRKKKLVTLLLGNFGTQKKEMRKTYR